MSFRIGQQVVCIDHESRGKYLPKGFVKSKSSSMDGLERGRVYTIRDINIVVGVLVCRLVEIVRDIEPFYGQEAYFAQGRFRPLKETKTDISIFTAMLTSNKQKVQA